MPEKYIEIEVSSIVELKYKDGGKSTMRKLHTILLPESEAKRFTEYVAGVEDLDTATLTLEPHVGTILEEYKRDNF